MEICVKLKEQILVLNGNMNNKDIRLCNQIGVIDSDYYNNRDNEGHI